MGFWLTISSHFAVSNAKSWPKAIFQNLGSCKKACVEIISFVNQSNLLRIALVKSFDIIFRRIHDDWRYFSVFIDLIDFSCQMLHHFYETLDKFYEHCFELVFKYPIHKQKNYNYDFKFFLLPYWISNIFYKNFNI